MPFAPLPPVPPPAPLTIQEAVDSALSADTGVQSARARLQGASARVAEAQSHALPTVSMGVMPLHIGVLDPALDALISGFGLPPNLLSENIQASQLLFDGFRVRDGYLAASAFRSAAATGVTLAQQNAAYGAADAYLGVLRAEALFTNAQQAYKQAETHLDVARTLEKNGAGTHFDVLQAQTQAANIEDLVIRARNGVELARAALETRIHEPVGERPLAPLPGLPDLQVGPTDQDQAVVRRPERVALAEKQEADRKLLATARDAYWPTVGLLGLYSQVGYGDDKLYVLGVSASWNVLDGGKRTAAIRADEATVASDEATLSGLEDGLRLEIRQAILNRDQAETRIAVAQQGVATAEEGYDLARLRFQQGVGTGYEEVDAETMLTQARNNLVTATYDLASAELQVDKAMGVDLARLLGGR